MLFNSHVFLFVFLPLAVAAFYLLRDRGFGRAAIGALVFASAVYYGWWNPPYLLLIAASIGANFAIGVSLSRSRGEGRTRARRALMLAGVGFNLALLGYFKYSAFFAENVNLAIGTRFEVGTLVLPLAISFFTFQQIAYLVDAWRGAAREYDPLNYALFVMFFPQLIAGPIVHHREMLPQFLRRMGGRIRWLDLAVGVSIFSIGLFKKTVLADRLAEQVGPFYDAAASGAPLDAGWAWYGVLSYVLQIYFDFSGYSDMAIGAARLFGIRLPFNFDSPYKARDIAAFWRRWHITLQRFFLDYVYIPLGGSREGRWRAQINILIVFLLSGLWHGAGWTFILFGLINGLGLVLHANWVALKRATGLDRLGGNPLSAGLAWALTLFCWTLSMVPFRADSLATTRHVYAAMLGLRPGAAADLPQGVEARGLVLLALGALIALAWPNTQEIMARYRPGIQSRRHAVLRPSRFLVWRPNLLWATIIAAVFVVAVLHVTRFSVFIYYQF
jgi:D-alanyl-lipoteichoic acid acyltransferase DltB (MBOAT superfamily)